MIQKKIILLGTHLGMLPGAQKHENAWLKLTQYRTAAQLARGRVQQSRHDEYKQFSGTCYWQVHR